ncbi:MAG TPA: hypothetical protein VGR56_02900 [Nitrososphaerales archaeon]|nr:hypothetical protein [Nitrososphaerales archaeon]
MVPLWGLSDLVGRRNIGKSLMDLELVSGSDGKPSTMRLLAKDFLAYLGAITFGVAWLVFIVAWRRSLSEKLTGTCVVSRRQS